MADNESTSTVGDTSSENDDGNSAAPAVAGAFPFDEQTLGRSASVFDAGVELTPPLVPPFAGPPPMVGAPVDATAPDRPLSASERRRRVRLEARRVRRVVRHIEPWSVLKISVLFYICLWIIFMLAGLILWSIAERSGTLTAIEDLVEDLFALDPTENFWRGNRIFQFYSAATLILSVAGITFNVLLCVLYNLISDLTGGVRLTVIEEETARFVPPRRRAR